MSPETTGCLSVVRVRFKINLPSRCDLCCCAEGSKRRHFTLHNDLGFTPLCRRGYVLLHSVLGWLRPLFPLLDWLICHDSGFQLVVSPLGVGVELALNSMTTCFTDICQSLQHIFLLLWKGFANWVGVVKTLVKFALCLFRKQCSW